MGLTDIIAQINLYFLDYTGNTLKKKLILYLSEAWRIKS